LEINLALYFLVKLIITSLQEVGALLLVLAIQLLAALFESMLFANTNGKRAASTYEPLPDAS